MTTLIKLPFRLGVQAARLATRPAVVLLRHAAGGGGQHEDGDQAAGAGQTTVPRPPVRPRRPVSWEPEPDPPTPAASPSAPPPRPARTAAPAPDPGELPEPLREDHVSEEPVLVAESADPEATEPPGAEVTVEEPWPGYRRAKASEIISTIPDISREELVVAQLYETMHRRRKTVLEAIERQLKVGGGPAANGQG